MAKSVQVKKVQVKNELVKNLKVKVKNAWTRESGAFLYSPLDGNKALICGIVAIMWTRHR